MDGESADSAADGHYHEREPEGVVHADGGGGEGGDHGAQGRQTARKSEPEPSGRGAPKLHTGDRLNPDQKPEGKERVREAPYTVDQGHEKKVPRVDGKEEEDGLEDHPDRRAELHDPLRTPDGRQRPGEPRGHHDGEAVDRAGDQRGLRAVEPSGPGQVAGKAAYLDAVADHEDKDGDETPEEGPRDADPLDEVAEGPVFGPCLLTTHSTTSPSLSFRTRYQTPRFTFSPPAGSRHDPRSSRERTIRPRRCRGCRSRRPGRGRCSACGSFAPSRTCL